MSEATSVGWMGCGTAARPSDDVELHGLRADRYFRDKDVLDIGTGNGRMTWLIAPLARSVTGIDPDAEAIRDARREMRRRGLQHVRFRVGPAQALGVARRRFDTALFSWSL